MRQRGQEKNQWDDSWNIILMVKSDFEFWFHLGFVTFEVKNSWAFCIVLHAKIRMDILGFVQVLEVERWIPTLLDLGRYYLNLHSRSRSTKTTILNYMFLLSIFLIPSAI